jgi:hypothetical protein
VVLDDHVALFRFMLPSYYKTLLHADSTIRVLPAGNDFYAGGGKRVTPTGDTILAEDSGSQRRGQDERENFRLQKRNAFSFLGRDGSIRKAIYSGTWFDPLLYGYKLAY